MERYAIAAFSSRSQVFAFEGLLKRDNVPSTIVHTPQKLALGCGLSLQIPLEYMDRAREIYNRNRATSFSGFYIIEKVNGRTHVMGERC